MYVANGEPSPHALAGLSVAHVARWTVPEQYRLHRAVLKVAIVAVPTQDPHVARRARVALLADIQAPGQLGCPCLLHTHARTGLALDAIRPTPPN